MKRLLHSVLLLSSLAVVLPLAAAKDKQPEPTDVLGVVITEPLRSRGQDDDDYNRLALAFETLGRRRGWPVKVEVERFAANNTVRDKELRVVTQSLRQVVPGTMEYRAWVTLVVGGQKHDFGVLRHDYMIRPGERTDLMLDRIFLGFAAAAADKIEPILFPQLAAGRK